MRHGYLSGINGRRVNPDDGAVEYSVQWSGEDGVCDTWEPRCNLPASCTGPVSEVDAREETAALHRIASWAKRGGTSEDASDATPPAPDVTPPLHGIVVHSSNNNNGAGDEGRSLTSLVALGERVLADATSHGLNPKKKRLQNQNEHDPSYGPALLLEKCWREQHAVSFMHTCAISTCRTSAPQEFELGTGSDKCRDASSIEIYGIAPAALVRSGQMYGNVTNCDPLTGHAEAEPLFGQCKLNSMPAHTTQSSVRGKQEQLVVRYFIMEENGGNDQTLLTMPLCVFRRYYPQLLLDFLLRHALVMESS
ncbi:hypothetical protein MOQ_007875 [Trypanosoma cruzi marinkellei]|uniref:Chromo domain-containing protein n=1 Tax=Trypanosoma cruzi marinkellei TaxID=85056 RepID=K2MML8_TRYCR|nr:hypothetical protein MOQ_007875 [Trypanosoma cruzi marinkellei]